VLIAKELLDTEKGLERTKKEIALYLEAKLAGADEGKILDGTCLMGLRGKALCQQRDVLNRCPALTNTERSSRNALPTEF
jgi:hypothetical protein